MKKVLLIFNLLLFAATAISQTKEYSILFIGNSLTYSNDLPELVKKKALDKEIKLTTKTIAYPNYALEDHWNDGDVQRLIASDKYDYVIIQQGPSSQAYGKTSLVEYGAKFKNLCATNNTKLCFFMVWPSQQYYHTFNGVIANYSNAALENNAILIPVGKIWKAHFDKTNNFDYYSSDNFHPSAKGSNSAAQIIVNTLFN